MPKKSGRARPQPPRDLRSPRGAATPAAAPARSPWLWIAGGLMLVALIGMVALLAGGNQAASATPEIGEVVTYGSFSRDHVETPQNYAQTPPVGGAHSASWQNCGIYDSPVPEEKGVHSLEHGAVWITYRPNLPEEDVERLRVLTRGHSHMLLSPYPGLPAPVVASAWGAQLQLNAVDEPALLRFISDYERGRQTPEPGAPCSSGVGTPVER